MDPIQITTNLFPSASAWINACRHAYCALQGLNGIHYWLSADSTPFHTILRVFTRYNTTTAGGVTVAQWLADAMAHPDGVVDRVDEGTLVTDYPGVEPIACLAPPP